MTHTNDIGIMLSEILPTGQVETFNWQDAEASSLHRAETVACVDVSDASNPIVELGSGERFQITITRIG